MDQKNIENAILTIIKEIGDNPSRDGLLETPARVARAYKELFEGYSIQDEKILGKQFETTYTNGNVSVNHIPVYTFCEHHMLPFLAIVM